MFVEGRKGSEYELQYYNNAACRRKVVLSVDGLNVITGDTNWTQGYVAGPWETLKIPGWLKDNQSAAKFIFSSVGGSYNQHNDAGDKVNVGVIGCLAFNEKVNISHWYPTYYHQHYHYDNSVWKGAPLYGANHDTFSSSWFEDISNRPRGISSSSVNCCAPAGSQGSLRGIEISSALGASEPDEPLGTGWGNATSFNTTSTTFNAVDTPCQMFTIYYDSRKGLAQRGIKLIEERIMTTINPNPFPGFGGYCPQPK